MTQRVKERSAILLALVNNNTPTKADAIVVLEGDGEARVAETAALFKAGYAKTVVVSGGATYLPFFTVPARALAVRLCRAGVPLRALILENESQNTHDQGLAIVRLAKKKRWRRILLVTSLFHQLRAHLTFLQAMRDVGYRLCVINAPARGLSWFKKTAAGRTRLELFQEEMKKIHAYQKKGDAANFSEALAYEQWKERHQ